MQSSLVELMAWKGNLHFVDPTGHGFFIDQDLPNIMGHRDGAQTTCPGKYAYARLPAIREATRARMAQVPPSVRIDAPLAESRVSGVVSWTVSASAPVTQVLFYADDSLVGSDTAAPWAWKWNSAAAREGQCIALRAVVRLAGAEAQATVNVSVDNTPPTGSSERAKPHQPAHHHLDHPLRQRGVDAAQQRLVLGGRGPASPERHDRQRRGGVEWFGVVGPRRK